MLKSENVATPFAALAAVVPESIPPPGLFRIAAVTLCVAAVTVLPNASWTATWTAGLIAPPDRVARGWPAMPSLAATGRDGPAPPPPHAAPARTMAGAQRRHTRGPTRTVWTTWPP